MSTRMLLAAVTSLALAASLPAVAQAQDVGVSTNITMADVFRDGGTIGWMIVVLSVVLLGMCIEYAVTMRKEKLAPPELIDEVEALFEAGDYQEAIELCEAEKNFFTEVVAAGLPKLNASFEAIEKALVEMTEEQALKLHSKVSWLSFITAVAPMLGLLGTVTGMYTAFKVIAATKGQADPGQLAKGISGALVTTIFGLIVAIPGNFAFSIFRNKVVKLTIDIGAVVMDLFERFRPTKAAA